MTDEHDVVVSDELQSPEQAEIDKARVRELISNSEEQAEAYRSLLADLQRGVPWNEAVARVPKNVRPQRIGRPPRHEAHAELADQAPFPELVTLPADRIGAFLRANVSDAGVLRAAHRFEVEHGRRKSVLREIEIRLRAMHEPVGGPLNVPWRGYDRDDPEEIVREVRRRNDPQLAADVYAWEHYRRARPDVLAAAEAVAGVRARERVVETSPAALKDLPEPWPGYRKLAATTQARPQVAAALRDASVQELRAAREFETQTKNRRIMLQAIDAELARRED